MVTASDVLALFHELGIDTVTLENPDLLGSGAITSIDIMNILSLIEERYDCELDPELVEPENLNSCAAIAQIIEQSLAQ